MTQKQENETAIDLEAIGLAGEDAIEPDANDEIDQIFILFRKLPQWRQLAVLERMQVFLENDEDDEDWQTPNDNPYLLSAEELERLAIQKASS